MGIIAWVVVVFVVLCIVAEVEQWLRARRAKRREGE